MGSGGDVSSRLVGQGICERRIEVIIKMQKSRGGGVRSRGRGWSRWMCTKT